MKWFKFYGQDYLSDPKMLSLSACERSCFVTLLAYSSVNDNGEIKFLSEGQLMHQAGISFEYESWEQTVGVLKKFEELGMITIENGVIRIKNWEKRQEHNLTTAERVAKYRENKKSNENVTTDVTNVTLEENRIDKKRVDKIREEESSSKEEQGTLTKKESFSEFANVRLTSVEFGKLVEALGDKNTALLIEELGGYIASTGKKYASHYATLLGWARRKVQTHHEKVDLQAKKRTIAVFKPEL